MKTIILKENKINIASEHFLADYLISLGISPEKTNSFIYGPQEIDKDNPYDLDNMELALITLYDKIKSGASIFIQVDSDVDGFTSSAIFYSYFKERYPNLDITWRLQSGKEHGVFVDTIPEKCEVIIIPDAGSMQMKEQEQLKNAGKTVIILDHHSVTNYKTIENVVLVNNQSSKRFTNKYLSGAGVVYLFIEAYDKKYFDGSKHSFYLDLAALGIVSDMMDTRTLGNNYIIQKGLKQINNKMFQELLIKRAYSIQDVAAPTKIDIAFYIAPIINGLIRSGSQEEKELLFSAMLDNNNRELIEEEYRGKKRIETIYEKAARIASNAKSRQDAAKKRSSAFLAQKIQSEGLDSNQIIVVKLENNESSKVSANITGLSAMDLVKTYNKPALVLRETQIDGKTLFCGSGRSKDFNNLKSFLGFIRESNKAEYAEGHGNAFGAWFTEEGLKDFIQYTNEKLVNADFNNEIIEIDYWFNDYINTKMLEEFGAGKHLYGAGIPQPKFAFTFDLNPSNLKSMGKNGNTMKITHSGIDFIMFNAEKPLRQLKNLPMAKITIIGRSQINEYMGRSNVQVIIDDIDYDDIQRPIMKKLEDLI